MRKLLLLITICISSVSFGQTPGGGVTDIDGNTYQTVFINGKEWMAENLKTSSYSNGDIIPNITDPNTWYIHAQAEIHGWAHYDNNIQNENTYGKLYNWYTVADPRSVCPTGWHVPTLYEWEELDNFLGPFGGGKLKSIGTQFWQSPNSGATNESGFTGLPGGFRGWSGNFSSMGEVGSWWSSYGSVNTASSWSVDYDTYVITNGGTYKGGGRSIRCVQDNLGLININFNEKKIIEIIDLMGRKTTFKPNTTLIYIYDDGSTEKKFVVE